MLRHTFRWRKSFVQLVRYRKHSSTGNEADVSASCSEQTNVWDDPWNAMRGKGTFLISFLHVCKRSTHDEYVFTVSRSVSAAEQI